MRGAARTARTPVGSVLIGAARSEPEAVERVGAALPVPVDPDPGLEVHPQIGRAHV